MSTFTRKAIPALLCLGAAGLMACGGSSPVAPSSLPAASSGASTLHGTVVGFSGSATSGVGAHAVGDPITVSVVEDPDISTVVGDDGSFTLRGLPEGGFTLVFTQGATTLGTLSFTDLAPNQEIEITVDVSDGSVVLLDEHRDGIGHGDVEIEGLVEQVLELDPAGDSRFVIDGVTVLAQPGVTAIREGNAARSVGDLVEGTRVHVKGVWLPVDGSTGAQEALAHEIVLQSESGNDDTSDDDQGGNEQITICHKGKTTLTISKSAWPAHQAHGDTLGACE